MLKNLLTIFLIIISANIISAEDDFLTIFVKDPNSLTESKFGYKNSKGEIIVPFIYDWESRGRDIGNRLEFVSNPKYIFLGEFNEGFAVVYKKDIGYGFVNSKGEEVIPCQYKSALAFTDGLAAVENEDGKWGYIDTSGTLKIPYKFHMPQQFYEGIAHVGLSADQFIYIDTNGKQLSSPDEGIGSSFSNGRGMIFRNNKFGFIDRTGNTVIPIIYDNGTHFFDNNQAAVAKNGRWGSIDNTGNVIIPFKYEFINGWYDTDGKNNYSIIYDGKFIGRNYDNELKGYIRDDGKLIIAPKYHRLQFDKKSNSVFAEDFNGKIGIFDLDGNLICPFEYDSFKPYGYGLYCLKKDGYYGFVDSSGKTIIPFEYEESDGFIYDVELTYIKKGEYWNIIDRFGKELVTWCTESEIEAKANNYVENMVNTAVDLNIPLSRQNNDNIFALIFGNEEYMEQEIPDVSYAKRDAEIFTKYMAQTIGIPDKNIHYRANATLSQMKSEISWASKIADVYGKDASFIIYFAGHGIPDPQTGEGYILPSDGYVKDFSTLLPLNYIYDELGNRQINGCFVFIDACFSGKTPKGELLMDSRSITIRNKQPKHPNLFVLTAASENEVALPFYSKGHGLFTYHLLNILNETAGKATISEIANYVKDQTVKSSLLEHKISQTPTIFIGANIDPSVSFR